MKKKVRGEQGGIGSRILRRNQWVMAPLLVGLMLLLSLGWEQSVEARSVLTVLAGRPGDGSARFLADLAVMWQRLDEPTPDSLVVQVVEEPAVRIRALERGQAHFGLVQASQAASLLGEHKSVVAVGLLWPNYLHVLTRLKGFSSLSRHPTYPVVVAPSAGYVLESLLELNAKLPDARSLLRASDNGVSLLTVASEGKGMVVFSAPAPLEEVARALDEFPDLRVLPPSSRLAEELKLMHPWLRSTTIPSRAYRGVTRGWALPATHLLMVGRRDLPAAVVEKMIRTLYRRRNAVTPHNPFFGGVRAEANTAFAELVPFHPAAAHSLRISRDEG